MIEEGPYCIAMQSTAPSSRTFAVGLYYKCCGWLILLLIPGTALHAQVAGSIRNQQTTLVLQAGREEPRLVSLQSGSLPAWPNGISERLIDSIEEDGRTVSLHWKLDERDSHISGRTATFVYQSSSPRLRLTWKWEARAEYGPVEHSITIENLSPAEIWLPLQDSFRFRFQEDASHPLQHWYVDKGAGKPSEVGTHQVPMGAGYRWRGRSSTYARDQDEREIIPWFMVERENRAQDGWYVGIEFSGRTRLTLQRDAGSISGAAGLDPDPGPFRTRLLPHETFAAPTVFVGGFSGGADGAGNILRPWVRQVLNNPVTWKNSAYPPLVNNSWGSGMQIDEALALRMVRDSAELGLELFHLDAGWFRGVGDWYPSPSKFPHGFAPIVSEAHRRGLRFGIWVNWAEAGIDNNPGALNVRDPKTRDWLVADAPPDWQPADFVGRTIDLGFPPAGNYARQEVERIITQYHLDMLEHDGYVVAKNCSRTDHPHAAASPPRMSTVAGSGIAMADNSDSTDVSYHAVRAYYDIYSQVRHEHPELLLEICNDGGRMVDFGSASHGDYFSITDSYDPVSNRRAFYDASHVLPAAMLETYEEKWPAPKIENFRYMLRSGMMGMLTIMQDTNTWTADEHAAAKAEFALYKEKLRPLIRDAELYHVSERPDGVHWDGMEYFDSNRRRGILYTFRGSTRDESQHRFPVEGVQPGHDYRLHFTDHSEPDRTVSGRELLDRGLTVALPLPVSSELVFIDDLQL
jgi:Melibiase